MNLRYFEVCRVLPDFMDIDDEQASTNPLRKRQLLPGYFPDKNIIVRSHAVFLTTT